MPDISQLKDIHLPPAIHDFPTAYGWWLLLILVIICSLGGLYLFRRNRRNSAVKRSALSLLDSAYVQFKNDQNSQSFLEKSNQVLKRYCLTHYPDAVGLSGAKWSGFLTCYSPKTPLKSKTLAAFQTGLYQTQCEYDPEDLYKFCSSWLKNNTPPVIESIAEPVTKPTKEDSYD